MVQIDIRETYSFGEYSFKNYTMLTEAEKNRCWNGETMRLSERICTTHNSSH